MTLSGSTSGGEVVTHVQVRGYVFKSTLQQFLVILFISEPGWAGLRLGSLPLNLGPTHLVNGTK